MLKDLKAESLLNLIVNGAKIELTGNAVTIEVNNLKVLFDGTISEEIFEVTCFGGVKHYPLSKDGAEKALNWVNSEVDEFVQNVCG